MSFRHERVITQKGEVVSHQMAVPRNNVSGHILPLPCYLSRKMSAKLQSLYKSPGKYKTVLVKNVFHFEF